MMTDDELYHLFYPDKFKPKNSYAPVDYAYVTVNSARLVLRNPFFGRNTVKNVKGKE